MNCDHISEDLVGLYINIAHLSMLADPYQQYTMIKLIERDFESEADTDLGEFIEEFVQLLFATSNHDEIHQDVQDLLDVCDLNEDMLEKVGGHIEGLVKTAITPLVL